MAKSKAKFKIGQAFFHPGQNLFVQIDDVQYFDGKGWLYNLKCFKHEQDEKKPWKRYYEDRIINELLPMKDTKAMKVLYGNTNP